MSSWQKKIKLLYFDDDDDDMYVCMLCVCMYLNSGGVLELLVVEAIFMHYPISSNPLRSSPSIVYQRFLHSNGSVLACNPPVLSCGFPISSSSCSVCSESVWVFSISGSEEVPLRISTWQKWFFCNNSIVEIKSLNKLKNIYYMIHYTFEWLLISNTYIDHFVKSVRIEII